MEDINEPFKPEVAPPVPPPQCVPSPLVISVEEDGNPEAEADIVEVDPESVKFDNADEDKIEPAEAPAHGVGGAITPPSAEIRSSEQGLGLG